MRLLKLFIASSLDGYIAGPNSEIDWLFSGGDYGYFHFLDSIDTVIMGNKTYELMLSFGDTHYAGKRNYVFSRQKKENTEHITFIHDRITEFVTELKNENSEKGIWLVGGGEIISQCYNAGLIDVYIIAVHPVILGSGIALFPSLDHQENLVLSDTKIYPDGLLQLFYNKA